ncbi:MAG: hypothetical protein LRY22_02345 [Aliarcobacter cryaerophilus]|nr:hypothetical protein [Aliarcobacter cryaerophilus]
MKPSIKGNNAKALFTATSIADVTGGSDLALATIESRELQKQALGNRTITGIGNGWQEDLKKFINWETNYRSL